MELKSFVTLFTGHHLSLSWVRLIQATHYHISLRLILTCLSLLHLGLQSTLLPSGFPIKTLYVLPSCPMHAECPAHLIPLPLLALTIQQVSFIPVLSTVAGKGCLWGRRSPCDRAAMFEMMQHLVTAKHLALHYAVFSSLLLFPPS